MCIWVAKQERLLSRSGTRCSLPIGETDTQVGRTAHLIKMRTWKAFAWRACSWVTHVTQSVTSAGRSRMRAGEVLARRVRTMEDVRMHGGVLLWSRRAWQTRWLHGRPEPNHAGSNNTTTRQTSFVDWSRTLSPTARTHDAATTASQNDIKHTAVLYIALGNCDWNSKMLCS